MVCKYLDTESHRTPLVTMLIPTPAVSSSSLERCARPKWCAINSLTLASLNAVLQLFASVFVPNRSDDVSHLVPKRKTVRVAAKMTETESILIITCLLRVKTAIKNIKKCGSLLKSTPRKGTIIGRWIDRTPDNCIIRSWVQIRPWKKNAGQAPPQKCQGRKPRLWQCEDE